MRRLTRFGVAGLAALLLLAGIYTLYWWIVAGQIKQGLETWRQSQKAHKIDAAWRGVDVAGFPFEFRVLVKDAVLRNEAWNPVPELRVARLTGLARPWNFSAWRLAAPDGLTADLAPTGGRPELRLAVKSAVGSAAIVEDGGGWLWLGGESIVARAGEAVPIKSADAWITWPARPASRDTDPSFGVALALRKIAIATPPPEFAPTIDEMSVGLTVKGDLPNGPLAQAIAAWRDAGGAVEVDSLHLQWGELGVVANGTLALDSKLQPIAAFSGGIEGFGAILNALVAADQLTPEQASIVRIALTSLAKPGADGKPQLKAPFTIQNGKMYLGPARLGAAPRITWE